MADHRAARDAAEFAERALDASSDEGSTRAERAKPPGARSAAGRLGRQRADAREAAFTREQQRFERRRRARPTAAEASPPKWRRLLGFFLPLVAVGGAALIIEVGELNPGPGRYDAPACGTALADDDLVHLAFRDDGEANAQLTRWDRCDDEANAEDGESLRDRARDALDDDRFLILWLALVLFAACAVAFFRQRWHTASMVGALLTAAYVIADLYENRLLRKLLDGDHRDALATVAAVKFGALIGASSMVVVASALIAGGSRDVVAMGTDDPRRWRSLRYWGGRPRAAVSDAWRFVTRWRARFGDTTRSAPTPGVAAEATSTDKGGMGISCSGGGIRSAAFTLGALQALDEPPSVVAQARWLSAVSGGSYMAAAWVTGRDNRPDEPVWGRRSPEEDHLRRHASYLAPGIGGKLWGLTRFVFGFGVNLGVVVLSLLVVMVPVGWAIRASADSKPVSGDLSLAPGACIHRDGGFVVVLEGQTVRVSSDALRIGPGPVVEPAKAPPNKAKAEIEGNARAELETGAGASGATTTSLPEADACVVPELDAGDQLPGDTPGRTFEDGTTVPVVVRRPVEVSGRVTGCPVKETSESLEDACDPDDAEVVALPSGSTLVRDTRGTLALDDDAIAVDGDDDRETPSTLERACGEVACLDWEMSGWMKLAVGLPAAAAAIVGIGLVSIRRTDGSRRATERVLRRATAVAALAAVVLWVVPSLVVWLVHLESWLEDRLGLAGGVGTGTLLAALVAQLFATSGKSDGSGSKATQLVKRLAGSLRPVLVKVASAIVGPLLVLGLAVTFMVAGAHDGFDGGWGIAVIAAAGVLVIFGLGGDLNEWSLHPYYREHLRFAFAVDPRGVPALAPLPEPRDDPLSEINTAPGPDLIVCAAANIADDRLTAPGRPAVSWTFTREVIGSPAITAATTNGTYPPSGLPERFEHLASTWTAVAVSGAAFSPAMGKMSRPERMLFALGNLRLGVWFPNPRYQTETTVAGQSQNASFDWSSWYRTHHPRPWYLAKEALGLHRLRDPWVYVTDGGHYENLGLVELLRRRCTEIYCFDAAGDQPDTFGTLSDAMRIARSELEVEIDIRPDPMRPGKDDDGISRVGVWPGVVRYPDLDEPGFIVLAKLSVPRTAPFDIVDLARTLPAFPNHPTADQLYTDQKFEAYRALGHHLGDQARMVGGAIRILLEEYGMSVEDAVAAVQTALCAVPDPTQCPPAPTKSQE